MSFFRNWFYLYLKQSPSEVLFERLICQLGEPYRTQYPFPGLHRVADFALHRRKVIIEIDGASHDTPTQRYKDITTSIALEKQGWKVIRFRNEEVPGIGGPGTLAGLVEDKLATRPTLGELEAALLELPAPPVRPSKRRARAPKPAPKKAKKRPKSA